MSDWFRDWRAWDTAALILLMMAIVGFWVSIPMMIIGAIGFYFLPPRGARRRGAKS